MAQALWIDAALGVSEIAARVGVSETTIRRWARAEAWPPRVRARPTRTSPPAARSPQPRAGAVEAARADEPELIERLYRLVHHNLKVLESRMSDDTCADAEPERETRVIGNIVRNVEKLKELETEQSKRDTAAGRAPLTPEEEDRIRRKVVEHILRVRERKRRERGDG